MSSQPLEAIFRPALVLMTGRALGFCVTFIIPVLLVRVFNQEDFGSYKQLFLVFGTLFGIAQLGMAESLFYFLPAAGRQAGGYVSNTLLVLGLAGLCSILGLWFWREAIAGLLNNPAIAEHLPWLGLFLALMLMAALLEIVLTVRKRHTSASAAYAVSDLFRALLLVAPVLLWGGLRWMLYGAIAFAVLRLTATLYALREAFAGDMRPDAGLLRKQLSYALPFGLAGLIEILQVNYHMYAVSWHFDVATFAIYAVGCLQVPLFDFLTSSTCNVMMTQMRERLLAGRRREVWRIWLDTTRKIAMLMLPLIGGLLLFANEIILVLFSADYAASVPIFMIWTLATLGALLLTDGVLRVYAQTRFLILLNLIQLALIAVTIPWFIARFDLLGAVLVTLLSTLVYQALALARIKQLLRCRIRRLLPWRALATCTVITLLAMLPAWLLKSLWSLPPFPTLLLGGPVFCLSYLALLLHWGPLDDDENNLLRLSLKAPLSRLRSARRQADSA